MDENLNFSGMSLEERVETLEEKVDRLFNDLIHIRTDISDMKAKMEMLISQYDKTYNLLKYIIYILLGIVALIVGFKIPAPP